MGRPRTRNCYNCVHARVLPGTRGEIWYCKRRPGRLRGGRIFRRYRPQAIHQQLVRRTDCPYFLKMD